MLGPPGLQGAAPEGAAPWDRVMGMDGYWAEAVLTWPSPMTAAIFLKMSTLS